MTFVLQNLYNYNCDQFYFHFTNIYFVKKWWIKYRFYTNAISSIIICVLQESLLHSQVARDGLVSVVNQHPTDFPSGWSVQSCVHPFTSNTLKLFSVLLTNAIFI